jgi:hypothetical protein
MQLENSVVTSDQARKLKELGIVQHSFVWWVFCENKQNIIEKTVTCDLFIIHIHKMVRKSGTEPLSAFTTAELGVMLPEFIQKGEKEYRINQWKNPKEMSVNQTETLYGICYDNRGNCLDRFPELCFFKTEAQARAFLLIYLLENNLTTAAEVNERLKNS